MLYVAPPSPGFSEMLFFAVTA